MRSFVRWLLTIKSIDEDTRRRGRNVVLMTVGIMIMAVLSVPQIIVQSLASTAIFALIAIAMLIYMGVVVLARRGLVTLGALIFIAAEVAGVLLAALSARQLSVVPFFLVLSLLIAGLSLRPWQIWLVLAFNLVGLLATILALPNNPLNEPNGYQTVFGGALLLVLVGLISFLGAKTTSVAFQAAEGARADAQQAAQALGRANAALETTVAERTAALTGALAEVQSRADAQARLLAEVEQQRIAIRELSVPVIPISATTLIMPLVGTLDSTRLLQVQEQALQALERMSARYLVLDITGVPIVDSQVAQGLLAVVQAARLLGTEVLLVGIRPEVAQSLVGLGLNLQTMRTASDLQSALGRIALD
jgi:rsbT co-antagonist protein RsbR